MSIRNTIGVLLLWLLPFLGVAAEVVTNQAATTAAATPEVAMPAGVFTFASVMQLIFGLFLVLLMIVASAWLVKRFGRLQGGYTEHLKVVGGLAIGARERIVLVQVGEQQILLGIAPGSIRTLHVLEEPIPITTRSAAEPLSEKFAAILNKQRNQ